MKKQMITTNRNAGYWLMLWLFYAIFHVTTAAAGDAKPASNIKPIIINPQANYGINVGDQLVREIKFSVPAAYELTKKSLPKKASQFEGIELVDIKIDKDNLNKRNQYRVSMVYQVFVNPGVPAAMQLPKVAVKLEGGQSAHEFSVPSWSFWFAPLAVGDHETAGKAIQSDIKPPLLNAIAHKNRLFGLLAIAAIALIALLYMNAEGNWLPMMGGAFAQAHRRLKKLARSKQVKTSKEEKQALVYIHQAFNQHYGANIFARDVEQFVMMKPRFEKMKAEIKDFFDFSNKSLYDTKPRDSQQVIDNLVQLSKALRDCERGV